jgi:PAS domain S-box-containing protein
MVRLHKLAARDFALTGVERTFREDEMIVSKTDTKGIVTYANEVFLKLAGYTQEEILGKPHSIIRHPHMPKGVFKLLWDQIKGGREIFAYVVNRSKNGDHYWVMAHVTPSFDNARNIVGFHSNRRSPRREAVGIIQPLYQQLKAAEDKCPSPAEAMETSIRLLTDLLKSKGVSYDEFILSI